MVVQTPPPMTGGRLLLLSLLSLLPAGLASPPPGQTSLLHSRSKREVRLHTVFRDSALSGAISCSMTHAAVVPIDVVKTRMQTDALLAGKSAYRAYREILRRHGGGILLQGMAATSSGYFLQGFCKFGFYDAIKTAILHRIQDPELRGRVRLPILLGSSAFAEFIASWVLTPMEVTRIAMVMNAGPRRGTIETMRGIVSKEGVRGLYKGLPLILLRQIPYTCAKLAGYEVISEYFQRVFSRNVGSSEETFPLPMVHLLSGVTAGVLAAVVSQPADVLLSKYCGGSSALSECIIIDGPVSLLKAFREIGFQQSFRGLQPRAIMIGTLTAMQFLIYEQTKELVHCLGSSNGVLR